MSGKGKKGRTPGVKNGQGKVHQQPSKADKLQQKLVKEKEKEKEKKAKKEEKKEEKKMKEAITTTKSAIQEIENDNKAFNQGLISATNSNISLQQYEEMYPYMKEWYTQICEKRNTHKFTKIFDLKGWVSSNDGMFISFIYHPHI